MARENFYPLTYYFELKGYAVVANRDEIVTLLNFGVLQNVVEFELETIGLRAIGQLFLVVEGPDWLHVRERVERKVDRFDQVIRISFHDRDCSVNDIAYHTTLCLLTFKSHFCKGKVGGRIMVAVKKKINPYIEEGGLDAKFAIIIRLVGV